MISKKGMTLVEVVIAMAIFGMIMVAVFPAFIVLNLTNVVSKENVITNYMAQDVVEKIYNYSQSTNESDLINTLITIDGFLLDTHNGNVYNLSKADDDYQTNLTVTFADPDTNFITVLVVVESLNETISNQMSQIETVVSFGA